MTGSRDWSPGKPIDQRPPQSPQIPWVQDKPWSSGAEIEASAPGVADYSQEAIEDDKTDRLYSVEWSQWMLEILKNNRQALTEALTDKEDNDTASTNISQQPHQNKQKQTHDPRVDNAHTEDIVGAEAMDTSS